VELVLVVLKAAQGKQPGVVVRLRG